MVCTADINRSDSDHPLCDNSVKDCKQTNRKQLEHCSKPSGRGFWFGRAKHGLTVLGQRIRKDISGSLLSEVMALNKTVSYVAVEALRLQPADDAPRHHQFWECRVARAVREQIDRHLELHSTAASPGNSSG